MTTQREAERREWLLAHRGIGSSQAAAALGLDPYQTKAQLYDEVTSILDGHVPAERPDPMGHRERGIWLEPVGLAMYEERFQPSELHTGEPTMQDQEHEQLLATPDGVAYFGPLSPHSPGELVEVKWPTPDNFEHHVEYGLPRPWVIQGQAQLGVAIEMPRVCYMLCTGPVPWRQRPIRVDRHEPFIETMRAGVLEFWRRHIEPRERPTDGDEGPEAGVLDAVPIVPGEVVVTRDGRISDLCRSLTALEAVEARCEATRGELIGRIQELMAASGADVVEVVGLRRFTWRFSKETFGLDHDGLRAFLSQHGRDLDEFRTTPQKRKRPFLARRITA